MVFPILFIKDHMNRCRLIRTIMDKTLMVQFVVTEHRSVSDCMWLVYVLVHQRCWQTRTSTNHNNTVLPHREI